MEFIIRGKRFDLTRDLIEKKLKNIEPKASSKYSVMINGKEYPIKQVISEVTGLPLVAFTSQDAYRLLSRLGFEIEQIF